MSPLVRRSRTLFSKKSQSGGFRLRGHVQHGDPGTAAHAAVASADEPTSLFPRQIGGRRRDHTRSLCQSRLESNADDRLNVGLIDLNCQLYLSHGAPAGNFRGSHRQVRLARSRHHSRVQNAAFTRPARSAAGQGSHRGKARRWHRARNPDRARFPRDNGFYRRAPNRRAGR